MICEKCIHYPKKCSGAIKVQEGCIAYADKERWQFADSDESELLRKIRKAIEQRYVKFGADVKTAEDKSLRIYLIGMEQGLELALALIDNYIYHAPKKS